jgi:uncharacterized protein
MSLPLRLKVDPIKRETLFVISRPPVAHPRPKQERFSFLYDKRHTVLLHIQSTAADKNQFMGGNDPVWMNPPSRRHKQACVLGLQKRRNGNSEGFHKSRFYSYFLRKTPFAKHYNFLKVTDMFRYTHIPFEQVSIQDHFWSERQRVNHEHSLGKQYDMCESTGRFDVLKLQWKEGQPNRPNIAWDSDTAKWLEAACYECQIREDSALREKINRVAKLFIEAQQPDGYLNSYFTTVEPQRRWKNLRFNHELYCAGHIFEAAVAHHALTGKTELLAVAERYAEYIGSVFGPGDDQIKGYCGHEEIELALIKLYRATGASRHLALASYFVEQRGQKPLYFNLERKDLPQDQLPLDAGNDYFQAHLPVREQKEAVGHAVRAVYLYCAMADLAREKNDPSLFAACERLWEDVTESKMYLTGGIGSLWHGEAFSVPYFLPNDRAYCETCASVGLIFWAHRMLQHSAESSYAEVIERALYNGALSGMSLDGQSFFYQNPLASTGEFHRQTWFECSCCPSNLSRLLSTLGSYIYSQGKDELLVHLYIGSEAKFQLSSGVCGSLRQSGDAPWGENARFELALEREGEVEIGFRIPTWATALHLRVNEQSVEAPSHGGYARVRRNWKTGDTVEAHFDISIRRIASNPRVVANSGQIALQRGPFIYCIEDADFAGTVLEIALPRQQEITARFDPTLLGGVTVLQGQAKRTSSQDCLYFDTGATRQESVPFQAVPYFTWDNRQHGAMRVWIPQG